MNPLVTLIAPVYNAMPYLKDFLTCLEAQTWRPLEVILVDDGSSDGSAQLLRHRRSALEAAGLTVQLVFSSHGGQAAAMNRGIPLIRGEYFTWSDADDLLHPDSVAQKVRWLMEHPKIGMVRSNGIVMDADKGIVLSQSARPADRCTKDVFEDLLLDRTYCYAGCYMVRTGLFFSCYPEKKIPESPEGQNLQLLLPPASRSLCGYLDQVLHTYCRRSTGHSSMDRSYQQTLQRIENFTALRMEILDHCDCDRERCRKLSQELETKNRNSLLYSALQRARKELKHENRNPDLS